MFPRKSAILRYIFLASLCFMFAVVWLSGPGKTPRSTWQRLLTEIEIRTLDESRLRTEFEELNAELNGSYSSENKTLAELYKYVKQMRSEVPVNPHKFSYVLNPTKICKGQDIFLLAYIHTAPEHYKRRTAIRESWGNRKNFEDIQIRVVFLAGQPKDMKVQEALQMEFDMYGDIVQENFVDSYRNLTYKGIMGLKWVSSNCMNAHFVMKADDDIFVNIFNVVSHLKSLDSHENHPRKLLLCLVWYRMKVIRDRKSKWYLSRREFHEDYFPTYCSGSAFMMTTDVIQQMYEASLFTPFFWVDDFYVTGLLAHKVGVVHKKFNSVYFLSPSKFFKKFTEDEKWRTLTFGHVHNLNQWSLVWKKVYEDRNLVLQQRSS